MKKINRGNDTPAAKLLIIFAMTQPLRLDVTYWNGISTQQKKYELQAWPHELRQSKTNRTGQVAATSPCGAEPLKYKQVVRLVFKGSLLADEVTCGMKPA